ncbi:MAG: hypothetical protein V1890_05970 [Candidatus Zixiibacteriota bacterium]
MDEELLSIADLQFLFSFDGFPKIELPPSYSAFTEVEKESNPLKFSFLASTSLPKIKGKKVFSAEIWELYTTGKRYFLKVCFPDSSFPPPRVGIFSSDFSEGEIFCSPLLVNPLYVPLDQLLMVNILANGKGLLIHGAGVSIDGRGILFAGKSDSGKTTIARLCKKEKNAVVLSDDRVILRKIENRFFIYGTPWHGELEEVSNQGVPLDKIFLLNHGKKNLIVQLKGSQAIGQFLRFAILPFWNHEGMSFILRFSERLIKDIPCHKLYFIPDKEIINRIL